MLESHVLAIIFVIRKHFGFDITICHTIRFVFAAISAFHRFYIIHIKRYKWMWLGPPPILLLCPSQFCKRMHIRALYRSSTHGRIFSIRGVYIISNFTSFTVLFCTHRHFFEMLKNGREIAQVRAQTLQFLKTQFLYETIFTLY